MDILKSLLDSLDKDATTKLYEYIKLKNKRKDVKNMDLIAAIQTNDINSILKLYPDLENSKSAYHAVRKRLTDMTLRFIAAEVLHLEIHDDACKTHIELSKYLYQISIPVLAQKMLRKAEKHAIATSNHLVLNEVYTTWLAYQKYHQHEAVPMLTEKLRANQYAIIQDNNLAIAYAHLSARIQQIQLQHQTVNLTALITDTMAYYDIDLERLLTLKSIVKILDIANEYAAIYQDYSIIERFVNKVQLSLSHKHLLAQEQIQYLLQTLYYLANYQLRIQNHEESLRYLAEMQATISARTNLPIDFQLKHNMLLSLNHFFKGEVMVAKSILESSITTYKQDLATPVIIHDIHACLALYTCMQQDKACLKYISLLTQSDLYYEENLGLLWVIKKNLMEIIAYIQFEYIDLAFSRITSFKRRYQQFLKKTGEERVLTYVKLLEQFLQQPQCIHTKKYQDAVHSIFKNSLTQDIFNNCYYSWICSQWSKQSPYEVLIYQHNSNLP